MKLSEILFENTKPLWDEATRKDFVVRMAKGTLNMDRFKYYMIQDYLYLGEYIGILKSAEGISDSPELSGFIRMTISETEGEIHRVHIPNMKKIGITDEDLANARMERVIEEYIAYMKNCLKEHGLKGGLTALLQCSWVYAYIGETESGRCAAELKRSPYKDWFDAYTCQGYLDANRAWIELIDGPNLAVNTKDTDLLLEIFRKCAEYENRFWDVL